MAQTFAVSYWDMSSQVQSACFAEVEDVYEGDSIDWPCYIYSDCDIQVR